MNRVLWISRHPLWKTQKELIQSLHGKKCVIEQVSVRFQDYDHFCDYLDQHKNTHHVYAVVPEKWKTKAIQEGYSLGTIHRPQNTFEKGKKKRVFRIEYHASKTEVKRKRKGKSFGSKGYKR